MAGLDASRRTILSGAGLLGLLAGAPEAAQAADAGTLTAAADADAAWLQAVLERYEGFGDKASGGAGDLACGAWLEEELRRSGYACRRQAFETPFFEVRRAQLSSGAAKAMVTPQAIVAATGPTGLNAPLRAAACAQDLSGAIAVLDLPFKRWGALADPQVAGPLADAFRRGAIAAVLVTNGPTHEAVALNVSARKPGFDKPVVILAPRDAQPFLAAAAAGDPGALVVEGQGGRRPAFNLIARLDRGAAKDLILSTPRSGWFGCAAERGSGLAVWLFLASWLARANAGVNVELLAASGHEYDYLGGEHYLTQAPHPGRTLIWTHIGASAAARDWHEFGPRLLPLPSADSQRVLTASADVIEPVRNAFHGLSGLEATYVATRATAGGELVNVLEAGYPTLIGLYGSHRYFHTRGDDLRCVSGRLVQPVAAAFRTALADCLGAAA